ncbi:MAG: lipoprotein [Bacteroidaceae bacterium]|nr:lipoprotein [Bacteroidaceae bacterium]
MKRTILIITTLLTLAACSDEGSNSGYPVYFSCDATIYPYNIVQGYGQYITITRSGGTDYKVRYYEGREEVEKTERLTAIQLQQGTFHYGLGGLIIGTPSAFDGNKWAFDLACPKCDLRSRKLTVTQPVGHAHCEKCGSKYDLNSGGIPIEGDTRPLWRYRVVEGLPPYIVVAN